MFKLLQKVSRKLTVAIPLALLAGFIYGIFFDAKPLKGLVLPLTFMMVYPMMVNLNWEKLFKGKDFNVVLVAQVVNFVLVPFFAFVIGKLFFSESPYLMLGIFLSSLFPTSGMTITWTGFSKGNIEAAVKMTLIGLTLGTFLSPFYLKFALGKVIPVNIAEVFKQILLIIVVPMLLGALTKWYFVRTAGIERFKNSIAVKFPPFSTLGVLGIVFVAMAMKARSIYAEPLLLLAALVPVVILYSLNIALVTYIARRYYKYEDAVALVFGTVARNLSIALALAVNAFGSKGSDAALVLSASFIIQAQAMAWYSKLTNRLLLRDGAKSTSIAGEGLSAKA